MPIIVACVMPVLVSFFVISQPMDHATHAGPHPGKDRGHGEKKKKDGSPHRRSRHHDEKEIPAAAKFRSREIPLLKKGAKEQAVKCDSKKSRRQQCEKRADRSQA